ncbi:hypothetical protein Tco_0751930 [Tanacetum coccineum]|uniref:Uncharacterized protein n=1 Tax=Tanacetum coccineum TaxID=301880 RepID=A0ABQ4Z5E8_9ASTR
MAALICDEVRNSVNSLDWEPQFILRCRREITKDLRLAREINALCARVTAIVDQREMFVDELDMLAGRHVPDKMVDFIKQPCILSAAITCVLSMLIDSLLDVAKPVANIVPVPAIFRICVLEVVVTYGVCFNCCFDI